MTCIFERVHETLISQANRAEFGLLINLQESKGPSAVEVGVTVGLSSTEVVAMVVEREVVDTLVEREDVDVVKGPNAIGVS